MGQQPADPLCRDSLAELKRRLELETPSAGPGPATSRAELRERFARVGRQWSTLIGHMPLQRPELLPLRRLAERSVEVLKLVYAELGDASRADGDAAGALLAHVERLHERVDRQVQLLDVTVESAGELHEVCAELLSAPTVSSARLKHLVRRLMLDVESQQRLDDLLPEPGLSLSRCLPTLPLPSAASAYCQGIQTARLLAWAVRSSPSWQDRVELLVAAALLQDVGTLSLEMTGGGRLDGSEHRSGRGSRMHPGIGSALVAGLQPMVVDLPMLIARHHERLDGTGFPGGIAGPALTAPARLLTAAVRLTELLDADAAAPLEESGIPDGEWQRQLASSRLRREAAAGAFDSPTVELLVSAVAPDIDGDAAMRGTASDDSAAYLSLHSAHSPTSGHPHFRAGRAAGMRPRASENPVESWRKDGHS